MSERRFVRDWSKSPSQRMFLFVFCPRLETLKRWMTSKAKERRVDVSSLQRLLIPTGKDLCHHSTLMIFVNKMKQINGEPRRSSPEEMVFNQGHRWVLTSSIWEVSQVLLAAFLCKATILVYWSQAWCEVMLRSSIEDILSVHLSFSICLDLHLTSNCEFLSSRLNRR